MRKPTKKQIDRFNELDQFAVDRYLDKTDFDASEWLDINEQEEYMKLYNIVNGIDEI